METSNDNTTITSKEKVSLPKEDIAIDSNKKNSTLLGKKTTIISDKSPIEKSLENITKILERELIKKVSTTTDKKTFLDCISALSLREVIRRVNEYNKKCSETPILKDDIVSVLKEGETYILLYYR